MTIGRGDLRIYQGDDFFQRVRIVNTAGDDVDISTYTARAQIRNADDVIELGASIDAPHVLLTLSRDDTALMSGRYRWDLQLVDSTGYTTTVIAGDVNVTAEVTR